MAPPWSFEHIAAPILPNPAGILDASSHNLSSSPLRSLSTNSLQVQTIIQLQTTSSGSSNTSYARLDFLGLPTEIRDRIWQTILDDINTSPPDRSRWAQRPLTEYSGLSLTCHTIRDETAFFWPRTIIQHRRIATFVQPPLSTLGDFKKLTLEIPMNAKYQFYHSAALILKSLAPVLQDLRIFFIGSDKFQVPLSLGACGIHEGHISLVSKRLAIDGQTHSIRQCLFVALRSLQKLHSLVISNHNYPMFPKMVLEHKPRLTQLRLETDSRTTVHRNHDLNAGGLTTFMIRPIQQGFPPVERLALSANASFNSLQIGGACTLNLRHLTWTVPDSSLQSPGGVRVNWYRDTANLFYVLRSNSKQLQTLRMCFHEAIYEADTAAGILIPAFRMNLEHLPLATLEIHINSQSPWFGAEIMQYLPNTLRRLYLSRELLDEQNLSLKIDNRYMSCQSTSYAGDHTASQLLKILHGADREEDYIHVGEFARRDFISLGGGKLGFIGYEYEPTKATRFGNSKTRVAKAADTRAWMLTLNGRLLDRERNAHLVGYDGGKYIPPQPKIATDQSSPQKYSIAERYGPMWVNVPPSIREKDAAKNEIDQSIIANRTNLYFGMEDEATRVFQNEQCVALDDVQERLWPDEVSVHSNEHWQTDEQMGMRKGVGNAEAGHSASKHGASHSKWQSDRLAHWVENWTWYSRTKSYAKDDERESFLTERSGENLTCLKAMEMEEGELQN